MVEGDLFREVEEDMRRERLARAWEKYGVYVLAVAVLIVVVTAGLQISAWWNEKRASETGERFVKALRLAEEGNAVDMMAAFEKIAQDAPRGYATLASLRRAAAAVEAGRKDDAIALYQAVANDAFADKTLRTFAELQLAALQIETVTAAQIVERLTPINAPGNAWRHSARELMGLAHMKAGNRADAEALFQDIAADPDAPADLRRRAQLMLALLVSPSTARPEAARELPNNEAKTQ